MSSPFCCPLHSYYLAGSFCGPRWRSFAVLGPFVVQFGDHLRSGIICGLGIICGAVRPAIGTKAAATRAIFCLRWWCDFLEIVASRARGENGMCSHPLTKTVILSQKIQLIEFLAIFFCDFFHLSHHPCEGGWLHMRFSPRAGDATIFQKSHHHRKQKIARVAAA